MSDIGSRPIEVILQPNHLSGAKVHTGEDWELVLRESHHRMKNTLTLLGASVRRDFSRIAPKDLPVAVDRFERRVVAFGKLYQLLSDPVEPDTVAPAEFFERLCGALSEAVLEPAGIRCEVAIECAKFQSLQCHRIALILTELVTNAAKHAFPDRRAGVIRIETATRDEQWLCTVADNGVGAGGPLQGTGRRVLEGLARSINAEVYGEMVGYGTRVTLAVPTFHKASIA
jgi:two-component sensor histidine kinase